MAASCRRLSPYFTAAPGGDKEHRGARLPRRGEKRRGEDRRGEFTRCLDRHSLSHPAPLACQSNAGLLNFSLNWRWSSPCQSLRDFRRSTKAKEHNEWKAPSQIDFKLNQTLVFNYLSLQPRRNFKVAEKEREHGVAEGGEWGEGRRTVGAECKWLCPCVVSEQVAQW